MRAVILIVVLFVVILVGPPMYVIHRAKTLYPVIEKMSYEQRQRNRYAQIDYLEVKKWYCFYIICGLLLFKGMLAIISFLIKMPKT